MIKNYEPILLIIFFTFVFSMIFFSISHFTKSSYNNTYSEVCGESSESLLSLVKDKQYNVEYKIIIKQEIIKNCAFSKEIVQMYKNKDQIKNYLLKE